MSFLIPLSDTPEGRAVPLGPEPLVLGRGERAGLQIQDARASSSHAEVLLYDDGESYLLRDLGSTNGTLVNGLPVSEAVLVPGDRIQIGRTIFLYSEHSGDTKMAMPAVDMETGSQVMTVSVTKAERALYGSSHPDREAAKDLRRKLAVLYDIGRRISSIRDVREMLEGILGVALEITGADRGFILLPSQATGERPLLIRRCEDDSSPPTMAMADQVMETGEAILTFDALQDARYRDRKSVVRAGMRAAMCAPLRGSFSNLGAIHVDRLEEGEPFEAGDLEFLAIVGSQAAIAVENAKLLEKESRVRSKLELAQREICAWNAHLEEKVRERTRELEQTRDRLVHSERLAAIGRLAGGISHQVNNPLTAVLGNAEMLVQDLPPGSRTRRFALGIVEGSNRIREIVNGLLTATDPGLGDYVLGRQIYEVPQQIRILLLVSDPDLEIPLRRAFEGSDLCVETCDSVDECLTTIRDAYWDVLVAENALTDTLDQPLGPLVEDASPGLALLRVTAGAEEDGALYGGVIGLPLPPDKILRERVHAAVERRRLVELNRRLLVENEKLIRRSRSPLEEAVP